jgi:polyisoprenoid-binding protein YceI
MPASGVAHSESIADKEALMAETKTHLTGKYVIDPVHSRIGFAVRHAMVSKIRGTFNEFDGSGFFDADVPSNSRVQLTIKADSIDTRNADRDAHLRTNDFFDMDNHPEITFTSTSVEAAGDDAFLVTGDLTVRGVTHPVTLDFEFTGAATDPFGNNRVGFEGKAEVNRKDWGINWNATLDAGGVMIGDKVTLDFDVSAIRSDDAGS